MFSNKIPALEIYSRISQVISFQNFKEMKLSFLFLKEFDTENPVDFNDLISNVSDIFIFIGLFKDLPESLFENLGNGTQVDS